MSDPSYPQISIERVIERIPHGSINPKMSPKGEEYDRHTDAREWHWALLDEAEPLKISVYTRSDRPGELFAGRKR